MACKHDNRTAYIQGSRPKRGFKTIGTVCVKCGKFGWTGWATGATA